MQMRMPAHRGARAALVAAGAAAVLAAPLATTTIGTASGLSIAGANTINDKVAVTFADATGSTTDVHVLGFNDLHGTLDPGAQTIYGKFAGGAAYLSKAIKDKRALYPNSVTVFAGDNIGASPLANSLFHEEPAVIVSNLMGVQVASVGNHEFDKGIAELKRIRQGGCHPVDGCDSAKPYALANGGSTDVYPGADFVYLAANVLRTKTGATAFPASKAFTFASTSGKRVKVGFIGAVLEATPTIVTPTGVKGLSFIDEADAANTAVAANKAKGINANVLVIHQGGFQNGLLTATNGCAGNLDPTLNPSNGAIIDVIKRLDPSIKVIVSGHTHAEYRCTVTIDGVTRLITSASSFGRVLSDINLTIDDATGEVVAASADNSIVLNATNNPGTGVIRQADPTKADPAVQAVVDEYLTKSAPLANQVLGKIQGDLTRTVSTYGESTLGDVIADAQLVATAPASLGGAQVAFMNPGGIRADLLTTAISPGGEAVGEVTYGEAFTVQPFGNSLVTKTMTGAQVRSLLEQQFPGCGGQTTKRILQISAGFSYEQDPAGATCASRIGRIFLNGAEVQPADSFRVTMNSFLAAGGDGFTVFNQGTNPLGGAQDIDAFKAAFASAGATGIAVPALDRIVAIPAP